MSMDWDKMRERATAKPFVFKGCGEEPDDAPEEPGIVRRLRARMGEESLSLELKGDLHEACVLIMQLAGRCEALRADYNIAAKASQRATVQSDGSDTEIARLKRVIERERTWSATWIERVKSEINSRRDISRSRGPYEWDDKAYFKEFGEALDAIEAAVGRAGRDLHVTDLTDCPTTNAEVQRARTEQAQDDLYDRVKRWRDDFLKKSRTPGHHSPTYYADAASGLAVALQEIDRERYEREGKH